MKRSLLLCVALSVAACGGISNTQQLQRLYGNQIDLSVLPRQVETSPTPKIVVFHDRNQCSKCQLGRISDWDEILDLLDSLRLPVPVWFVIAPPADEAGEIRRTIRDLRLQRYSIEIDSTNRFAQRNRVIPADALFHTFLLDEQNRIVVVGSPLFNDRMWRIYRTEIEKLCKQNGKQDE